MPSSCPCQVESLKSRTSCAHVFLWLKHMTSCAMISVVEIEHELIVMRCPLELLYKADYISTQMHVSRSAIIVDAVCLFLHQINARKGFIIPPYKEDEYFDDQELDFPSFFDMSEPIF